MLDETQHENSSASSASSSVPRQVACAVCRRGHAIYTCPRCAAHTCSAPCSQMHKARQACTGERDRVAYVRMNEYGWGAMMNDYVFLEDVGRKVEECGREIGRSRFATATSSRRGRLGRTDSGREGRIGFNKGISKREVLRSQLERMDIELEILPSGMEKSKLNQSTWNPRTRTVLLTIEFIFHPPGERFGQSESTFALLTHRNAISETLLTLLQTHTAQRNRRNRNATAGIPEWVRDLVSPDPGDVESAVIPQCLMRTQLDPPLAQARRTGYRRLDANQPLATLLRNTSFVEFPTVEVCDSEAFEGTAVNAQDCVAQDVEAERQPKRRKLDAKTEQAALSSLLGNYDSDDDEADVEGEQDMLDLLGDYAGSEDEEETQVALVEECEIGSEDDETEEMAVPLDPATIVQLLRHSQQDEEEEVGWSDSDSGNPE